jgi:hypothetical protein
MAGQMVLWSCGNRGTSVELIDLTVMQAPRSRKGSAKARFPSTSLRLLARPGSSIIPTEACLIVANLAAGRYSGEGSEGTPLSEPAPMKVAVGVALPTPA